jgi:hypothetical protein
MGVGLVIHGVFARPWCFGRVSGAGWSSLVARRAHNPEVAGSNPAPATPKDLLIGGNIRSYLLPDRRPGYGLVTTGTDESRHQLGGLLLHGRDRVRVHVERERDGRVTEPLRDDLGVNAGAQGERRVSVAEIVQANPGSPDRSTRRSNRSLNSCGWIGDPSGRQNTRS